MSNHLATAFSVVKLASVGVGGHVCPGFAVFTGRLPALVQLAAVGSYLAITVKSLCLAAEGNRGKTEYIFFVKYD